VVLLALPVALLLSEGLLAVLDQAPAAPSHITVRDVGANRVVVEFPDPSGLMVRHGFRARKSPGTHRTVLLGDSAIYGLYLQPSATVGRFLEHLLREVHGPSHEVLTLAAPAISSQEVATLLDGALDHLDPDLALVYTGHNELLDWRAAPALRRLEQPLASWVTDSLRRWRTGRLLLAWWTPEQEPRAEGTQRDPGILMASRRAELRPLIYDRYGAELAAMAGRCQDAGVALRFVTPVSNGRRYGPVTSAFSRELEPGQRERFAELLAEARTQVSAGERKAATATLTAAAGIDPDVAELVDLMGELAWIQGREDWARKLDHRAWQLGEFNRAASDCVLTIMEEQGAARDVPVIDLLPAMERALAPGEPELFMDYAHPTVYGQYVMARELAASHSCAEDVASSQAWPEFIESCEALQIPDDVLVMSERAGVIDVLLQAMLSGEPEQHLPRARELLAGIDLETTEQPLLLASDLVLALFDEDADRARRRSQQLASRNRKLLSYTLGVVRSVSQLEPFVEQAGLLAGR
jgi:lysophospholipase L1-like esterase